ncbi:MAG: aminodeoxychorismate synthase component I [bacterium]
MDTKLITQVEEIKTSLSAWEIFALVKDEPYSFFLDSSDNHINLNPYRQNRYSFIASNPFLIFRSKGKNIELVRRNSIKKYHGNPLGFLEALLKEYKIKPLREFAPFQGGAVGYFGYELYPFIEGKIPVKSFDDLEIPDCYLGFYDLIFIFDHFKNKVFLSQCGFSEDTAERTKELISLLGQKPPKHNGTGINLPLNTGKTEDLALTSNFTREEYIRTISKIKEHIANGDIYQVNLSQRFTADFNLSPFELYEYLRRINPAPFAGILSFDTLKILSSSPERFLKVHHGIIETRPIKGTQPRGSAKAQDRILKTRLLRSQKDAAEHIMIVDVQRNDLGRICRYGTIKVEDLALLETYATVFHLVSTIKGTLSKGKGPIDCLRACFPGGSITGAPKIRAMEIINDLEPTRRDVYTGSMGYIGFDGNLDLSIVIRSLLIKDKKAYLHTGGGIVADSNPGDEYEETMNKAKALIMALSNRKRPVNEPSKV